MRRARRADAEEIKRAASRAAGLTRQLLAFSRKQILQPRRLSLNDVIASIRGLLIKLIGDDIDTQILSVGGTDYKSVVCKDRYLTTLAANIRKFVSNAR